MSRLHDLSWPTAFMGLDAQNEYGISLRGIPLCALVAVFSVFSSDAALSQSEAEMRELMQQMMSQGGGAPPGMPLGLFGILPVQDGASDITEIQTLLNAAGFPAGAVDGIPGPGTLNAVARFQASIGNPPTGQLRSEELEILRQRGGGVAPTVPVDIATIQRLLNERGFDVGPVDGLWGPNSQRQLEAFRAARGLNLSGPPTEADIAALQGGADPAAKSMPLAEDAIVTRSPGGHGLAALPAVDPGAEFTVALAGADTGRLWVAIVPAGAAPKPGALAWPGTTGPVMRIVAPETSGAYDLVLVDVGAGGRIMARRRLEVT